MVIYLTGVSNELTRAAHRADLGLLGTPAGATWRQKDQYGTWAADNGCFAELYRPGAFKPQAWLSWLETAGPERCLWATLPDVVGDAHATWERSQPYVETVRNLGFPVGLVLQNGLEYENAMYAEMLDACDAVFVGGSPECAPCRWVRPGTDRSSHCPQCGRKLEEWKLSMNATALCWEAQEAGKWVHVGRVNSLRRLQHCAAIGADSADGTYLKFGRADGRAANTHRLFGWLDQINPLEDAA